MHTPDGEIDLHMQDVMVQTSLKFSDNKMVIECSDKVQFAQCPMAVVSTILAFHLQHSRQALRLVSAYLPALLISIEAILIEGLAGQAANKHLVIVHCTHARGVRQEVIEPARLHTQC